MGEDVIEVAARQAELKKCKSVTRDLKIHGNQEEVDWNVFNYWYGADLEQINKMIHKDPGMGEVLSESLHILKAQVIWAVREEMARTLEDCLSRRIRALQLDAREAIRIAPRVAEIMAREMGFNENWEKNQVNAFTTLAGASLLNPAS